LEIDRAEAAPGSGLSRKYRQRIACCQRRLAVRGDVEFQLLSRLSPDEVERPLRQGFEVENLGWKRAAGTSVMSVPGMFDFFLRQARQLAAWGQLELALLHCGGRPIAFCYGVAGKGVFHSCKIGYDPAFADQSPGHLLHYHLLEHFRSDPERLAIDYMGPITEYHAHWHPGTYPVARLAVAPHRVLGRMGLWAYQRVQRARASCGAASCMQ
jgi:CelD/BcsL family acetyltransferase involved in cellulose biosynthesis